MKKIKLCSPQCARDGGYHYTETADGVEITRCPNFLSAQHDERMKAITAEQRKQATEAARRTVRDFAETRFAFSANDTADAFDTAQVPESLRGPAFAWAAKQGLIRKSGRYVMSVKGTTRHEIPVWDSLLRSQRVAS